MDFAKPDVVYGGLTMSDAAFSNPIVNGMLCGDAASAVSPASVEGQRLNERKPVSVTTDDRDYLRSLLTALEPFRAANPTATLQQLVTFLLVATDEGKSVMHYARAAGAAQGVMTRHLLDLGDFNRRREPGLELIVQKPDVNDRRSHLSHLSHKGRAMVGVMCRALRPLTEARNDNHA